uniref:Conserved oligomeric Golgi complex subunit 3 n=1 Tax=Terrapene triunguis TaxID=2587831 RepID=A0A674I115_9SAUR
MTPAAVLLLQSGISIRDRLGLWDRGPRPMAPLTDRQTDSVLELKAAAENPPVPAELPIEDLCSLTSQSLSVALAAAIPESTEDILLKGFTTLGIEDERIETAQQFFSWFAQLQAQMDQDEGAKYRQMRDYLSGFQEQCDAILNDVNSALQHLESLQKQYLFVSTKTGTLHEACEQLLKEQSELVDLAENIQQKLSYFNELENINTKLNSPTLSVNSEGFIPMLAKLDDCITYISSHPNFKDYPVYLVKFKQCLSKAMHLMKTYTVNTLQNLTSQLIKRDPSSVPNSDNAFTLFYVKFRAAAPKVRTLIEQIEQRSEKMPEYQQLLNEIHQCYLAQREHLLGPSITSTVTELTSQNNRDHCALVRSGCAFMVHVCQDEHQLYNEFFTKPTPKLDELLEKLCVSLYDVFRPLIIHVIHLETLSELCGILKNEMLEDHVQNNAEQLGAFAAGVQQMLEDVQERLVYRTFIYIQTDIIGYKPAPGDLAYPDKLEMMEQIAQSLKDEQKKLPSDASFSDVRLEDPESCTLIKSGTAESLNPRPQTMISPADLHGMWYPTVRRTLVCLSKLYRCIDRAVFQGLSQEALSACIHSLLGAADSISKNKTQVDGQLFLIKHLLILREQIAPFHTEFTIKEISLDLKKTRDAAFKILNPRTVPRFFRLNSNNALIQFLLEGTPEIREHYIDSKKDVDHHLKSACEQFIQQQTKQFIEQPEEFMSKVAALKAMASQGGPKYNLSQQPWAQPAKVNDLVSSTYKTIKTKLPSMLRSMSLYLANKDTEFILFKPIRNNIQQVFQKLQALLKEEFSNEDLQIIACPSMEQSFGSLLFLPFWFM